MNSVAFPRCEDVPYPRGCKSLFWPPAADEKSSNSIEFEALPAPFCTASVGDGEELLYCTTLYFGNAGESAAKKRYTSAAVWSELLNAQPVLRMAHTSSPTPAGCAASKDSSLGFPKPTRNNHKFCTHLWARLHLFSKSLASAVNRRPLSYAFLQGWKKHVFVNSRNYFRIQTRNARDSAAEPLNHEIWRPEKGTFVL